MVVCEFVGCHWQWPVAEVRSQKSEVRGLPNLGRVALARRGFFDIGRAEARAERKIEVRSQRSAFRS